MILVDTSVWVTHLRSGEPSLARLLEQGEVLTHPFVIGELALGNLNQRQTILEALQGLPRAKVATDDEVLGFIEREALAGAGIGYVDAHLIASARLTPGADFWTLDRRLSAAAERCGVSVSSPQAHG